MNRLLGAIVLSAMVTACGGSEGPGAGDVGDRTKYPDGPYGKAEGAIIANLALTASDGTPFSFRDVQQDEHNRVLLVTTTAGWCAACKEEQPKLVQLHRDYAGRGLAMVSALFEDDNSDPATVAQAASWKSRYELPFTVVLDANPFQLGAYYDRSRTPLNMVIDVDDMKILLISTGFDETLIRSEIEANLP